MPHGHVSQVQVTHQIVLMSGSTVLSLVDVADKAFLDIGNTFAQGRREHQDRDKGENTENDRSNDSNSAGIDTLKNCRNKNNAQDATDD